jgi:hypothetical protein
MPRAQSKALHHPVTAGADALSPEHFPAPQHDPIDIGVALHTTPDPIETEVQAMAMSEASAKNVYLDDLKFNEQPVSVVIPRSAERNAPGYVHCKVNGVGAEVLNPITKQWMRWEWLPLGVVLTVKRKYLEVLARARKDSVTTREVNPFPLPNQDGFVLERDTTQVAPFTVRHDPAGERGADWYRRAMTEY